MCMRKEYALFKKYNFTENGQSYCKKVKNDPLVCFQYPIH